jgi:acyl-CoA thioesterase I
LSVAEQIFSNEREGNYVGKTLRQSRTTAVVASIFLVFAAQSAIAAPRDSSRVKRILVLGDSLSAGFGLKSSQAWPALVTEKLRAAGLTNFEITNASQSGGTTSGGVQRLPAHLKRKIDIFILELGINDAFRVTPVSEIRNNLQAIIDTVKAKNPNARIIVCGMQLPNYTEDDYVFAFGQLYADLAAKNNAVLIPYFLEGVGGDPNLNQPDRVHPNAAGQRILAENVWRFLEPIAREVAVIPSASEGPHPRPSITR